MRKIFDLIGQIFGKLTVLKRNGHQGKETQWLCLCDCGKETNVKTSNLRSGHTKSCGCLKIEKIKLYHISQGHTWTKKEDKFLIDNHKIYGPIQCARLLNKSKDSVKHRCKGLGLCQSRAWSKQDIDILKEFYPEKGSNWCANKLKKSVYRIRSKVNRLGLHTKYRDGKLPTEIISRINETTALANCSKHGICEHETNKKCNSLRCRLCRRIYYTKRNNLEETKTKMRIWQKKKYATPLGKYQIRLRVRLHALSNNNLSFSKDLPYNSKQLCDHIENIRQNQNNCCPICSISYEINPFDIDHIVPTHIAKTREELLKLFDLENLSLLCWHCNRNVKRGRLDIKYNYGF
jgi:hypothetical protein